MGPTDVSTSTWHKPDPTRAYKRTETGPCNELGENTPLRTNRRQSLPYALSNTYRCTHAVSARPNPDRTTTQVPHKNNEWSGIAQRGHSKDKTRPSQCRVLRQLCFTRVPFLVRRVPELPVGAVGPWRSRAGPASLHLQWATAAVEQGGRCRTQMPACPLHRPHLTRNTSAPAQVSTPATC
jgi:hypothetical protein